MIERICLLGVGEAGFVLAQDLLELTEATLQLWDTRFLGTDSSAGNSAERHASLLQPSARVVRASSAATAAAGCQLVLSAVTADEVLNAARSVLPGLSPGSWYVDLNSVSPETKQRLGAVVEAAAGRFVDAAVMSPIFPRRIASPILLAGPHAETFEPIGQALGFIEMQAISTTLGAAAAAKMCRSVIVKGMEALVTESLLAARQYGVDSIVLDSLNTLFPHPDWSKQAHYLISRSLQHGARRAEEMREVARTVSDAGVTPWMSLACAQRQAWAAKFAAHLNNNDLEPLLNAISAQLGQRVEEPQTS